MSELKKKGVSIDNVVPNDDGDIYREWQDFSNDDECTSIKIEIYGSTLSSSYLKSSISMEADENLNPNRVKLADNEQYVIDKVLTDDNVIGFGSYGIYQSYSDLFAVPISDDKTGLSQNSDFISPDTTSLILSHNGSYPFIRPIYLNVWIKSLINTNDIYQLVQWPFTHSSTIFNVTNYKILSIPNISRKEDDYIPHWIDRDCGDEGGGVSNVYYTADVDECDDDDDDKISIKGSSTCFPIVNQFACNYVDSMGAHDLCAIFIGKGDGSSDGAKSICSGDIDIATMSRNWTHDEV